MRIKLLALLFLLFSQNLLFAKDFGIAGETFEVREKSLIESIKEGLIEAKNNGKLEEFQNKVQKNSMRAMTHPAPNNLSRAQEDKIWNFDPLYFPGARS